jgi:hypothetical protein
MGLLDLNQYAVYQASVRLHIYANACFGTRAKALVVRTLSILLASQERRHVHIELPSYDLARGAKQTLTAICDAQVRVQDQVPAICSRHA